MRRALDVASAPPRHGQQARGQAPEAESTLPQRSHRHRQRMAQPSSRRRKPMTRAPKLYDHHKMPDGGLTIFGIEAVVADIMCPPFTFKVNGGLGMYLQVQALLPDT